MLIIGRVILEDRGFSDKLKVYKKNIEVAIFGKSKDGKEVGFWVRADENGYFASANVPAGEYALKGIRLSVGYGDLIIIENRLSAPSDPFILTYKTELIFNGNYFRLGPSGRVQNLLHNIFSLDYNNRTLRQVRTMTSYTLTDVNLFDGEILNAGTVEEYFIQKYPESLWREVLESNVKSIRPGR
jgi:hypothetical protein